MPDHFRKVALFNEMIGYPRARGDEPIGFARLTEDSRKSITILLREELEETIDAINNEDLIETADGLADLVVVAMGAAHKLGINFDAVMDRVCDSNLSKSPGDTGRGFTGDAVKGRQYRPPNLEQLPASVFFSSPLDEDEDESELESGFDATGISDAIEYTEIVAHSPSDLESTSFPVGFLEDDGSITMIPYSFVEAARLRGTKGTDYMSGGVTREDLNPFGLKSYIHNVIEKAMRLKSLAALGDDAVNHEGLRDSCIDQINYLAFLVEFIDGRVIDR